MRDSYAVMAATTEAQAFLRQQNAIIGCASVPLRIARPSVVMLAKMTIKPTDIPVAHCRRAYVDGRFGQIHYRDASQATHSGRPPLLCFHMSPHSGRIYEKFAQTMGLQRRVIAPDTPGFGASDAPAVPPSIEDYAAAMGDVIDALKLGIVDVMGYHTGSETCVALALLRPKAVRKLVMISAPLFSAQELTDFSATYAAEPLTEDGAHLLKKWRSAVRWAGPGKTIAMIADDFPDAIRNPSISWWGHRAAFAYDLHSQLPRVQQPILLLNPDDDLHQQTLRAAGMLQRGTIVHLKNWGHGFLDLHTAQVAARVGDFLDRD